MKKPTFILWILLSLQILACSSIPHPNKSSKAFIHQSKENLLPSCYTLGTVEGYGSSEVEANYDALVNAQNSLKANHILIEKIEEFFQDHRMSNYQRTPELKAPLGTINYYYDDAFTIKTIATAYSCDRLNS